MRYLLLFLISLSAQAFAIEDTWLCIGETMAAAWRNEDGSFSSEGYPNEQKWILSLDGLKLFGSDQIVLSECSRNEYGLGEVQCRNPGGMADSFTLTATGRFFYFRVDIPDESFNVRYSTILGSCSKL